MTILDAIEGKRQTSKDSLVNGVVVAIVTDNSDPEKLGRVKVTFKWLSDDNVTEWARVATLMAGKDRGSLFTPEVEDEVLIAFEHGDINRPFVIGGIWNDEGKPSTPQDDNNLKRLKTRSGHQITFIDKTSEEKIEILSKSGHQILLDDTSGSEKITIKDKTGNNSIVIDSVQNSIDIEAQMKITVHSTEIELNADATMTIKAGANMDIQSGGPMTIQGAIVKIN